MLFDVKIGQSHGMGVHHRIELSSILLGVRDASNIYQKTSNVLLAPASMANTTFTTTFTDPITAHETVLGSNLKSSPFKWHVTQSGGL